MTYENLKKIVMGKGKGTFSSIVWERELPLRKAFAGQNIVTKRCGAVVRCGIEYDNMGSVQQKRQDGTLPAANAGLQWGEWAVYPYFIQHKGKRYLRCAEAPGTKMEVQYYLNGRMVNRAAVEPFCTKAAFTDHKALDVFTVNVDNIIAIR